MGDGQRETRGTKNREIGDLVSDGTNERFDVKLRGARLLAGSVSALETPLRLEQGATLGQGRRLDIQEIILKFTAL